MALNMIFPMQTCLWSKEWIKLGRSSKRIGNMVILHPHKGGFHVCFGIAVPVYSHNLNLLYLKEHKISSYIKLQDHEKRKTRAYKEDIGKYYNMKTQVFAGFPVFSFLSHKQTQSVLLVRFASDFSGASGFLWESSYQSQ